jgi:CysZ protein
MLDAVFKALGQMLSPPFRAILWKSIGLALILIAFFGVGLHHLLTWLAGMAEVWAEGTLGPHSGTPLYILAKMISIAAALGIIAGSVLLMPAITALVGSFFADDIALEVECAHYPTEPPGTALPIGIALIEGTKTALLAALVYLIALPFLLFAGSGLIIFFVATAYLLGREYFGLAAMRFYPPAEAKQLRRTHAGTVFAAGLFIAAFVMIPIVNLATPLFGMALMVHMHKRIVGERSMVARAAAR